MLSSHSFENYETTFKMERHSRGSSRSDALFAIRKNCSLMTKALYQYYSLL